MKPQAFQYGELRDSNDNIIREGTYGKKTPFATNDNIGILDYMINNFNVIQKEIEASGITCDNEGNPIVSEDVRLLSQTVTQKAYEAGIAASNAASSASSAESNANNAADSAFSAETSANAAAGSATSAGYSASNASSSASSAALSASNAANSAARAETAANTYEGYSVGDIAYRPYLKNGWVKANGATVNRADYPRLAQFATDHDLWTSDPTNEPWKYGVGDGSTTMVLPDYRGRVIQGGDTTKKLIAGLPDITGIINLKTDSGVPCGAFYSIEGSYGVSYTYGGTAENVNMFGFKASLCNPIYGGSSTVQPPSLQLVPQLRY